MTGFLKSWTMSIAGIIVFGSVCEMLLPHNAYKKYLQTAIGLMLIFAAVSPLLKQGGGELPELPRFEAYEYYDKTEVGQRDAVIKIYKRKLSEKIKEDIKASAGIETEVMCEVSENEENFGEIVGITVEVGVEESVAEDKIKGILNEGYEVSKEKVLVKNINGGG